MAFIETKQVRIAGVSACVPITVEENSSLSLMPKADMQKLMTVTGIERRHIAQPDTCTSDLCYTAAEKLIWQLGWDKNEIDGLVFVSQTPDYKMPATSPILQHRLGLSVNCFTLDISLGCSGYVYGMSTLAAYMQSGLIKKGLLLVGDTSIKTASPQDKSVYPLFGDAGCATALEFTEGDDGIRFHLGSDGEGYKAIMIKDGGSRHPFNQSSSNIITFDEGVCRNNLQIALDGMDVFSFGISKAPQTVNTLLEKFNIDAEQINYFFFHQANLMMNERIRKKLKLPEDKVPYSLKNFGNTSSASIPLTMVTESAGQLRSGSNQIVGCGFGVGLSWGTFHCTTNNLVIPQLIYHG